MKKPNTKTSLDGVAGICALARIHQRSGKDVQNLLEKLMKVVK